MTEEEEEVNEEGILVSLLDLDDFRLETIFEYLDYNSFFQLRSCNRRLRTISQKGLKLNHVRQYSHQFGIHKTWVEVIKSNDETYLKEATILFSDYVNHLILKNVIEPQNSISLTWIYDKIIRKREIQSPQITSLLFRSNILSLVEKIYEDWHIVNFERLPTVVMNHHVTSELLEWLEKRDLLYQCPSDILTIHEHNDLCKLPLYHDIIITALDNRLDDVLKWCLLRLDKTKIQSWSFLNLAVIKDNSLLVEEIYQSYEELSAKKDLLDKLRELLVCLPSNKNTIKWYLEKGGSFDNVFTRLRSHMIIYGCQNGSVEHYKLLRDTCKIPAKADSIHSAISSGSKDLCLLVEDYIMKSGDEFPGQVMNLFEENFRPALINLDFLDHIIKKYKFKPSIEFIQSKVIPSGNLETIKMAWKNRSLQTTYRRIKGSDICNFSHAWNEETISWLLENVIGLDMEFNTYNCFLQQLTIKPAIILIDDMLRKKFPTIFSGIEDENEQDMLPYLLKPSISDSNIYVLKWLFDKYPQVCNIKFLETGIETSIDTDSLEIFSWFFRERDRLFKSKHDKSRHSINPLFILQMFKKSVQKCAYCIIKYIWKTYEYILSTILIGRIEYGAVFESEKCVGYFIYRSIKDKLAGDLEFSIDIENNTTLIFMKGAYNSSTHYLPCHEEDSLYKDPIIMPKRRDL